MSIVFRLPAFSPDKQRLNRSNDIYLRLCLFEQEKIISADSLTNLHCSVSNREWMSYRICRVKVCPTNNLSEVASRWWEGRLVRPKSVSKSIGIEQWERWWGGFAWFTFAKKERKEKNEDVVRLTIYWTTPLERRLAIDSGWKFSSTNCCRSTGICVVSVELFSRAERSNLWTPWKSKSMDSSDLCPSLTSHSTTTSTRDQADEWSLSDARQSLDFCQLIVFSSSAEENVREMLNDIFSPVVRIRVDNGCRTNWCLPGDVASSVSSRDSKRVRNDPEILPGRVRWSDATLSLPLCSIRRRFVRSFRSNAESDGDTLDKVISTRSDFHASRVVSNTSNTSEFDMDRTVWKLFSEPNASSLLFDRRATNNCCSSSNGRAHWPKVSFSIDFAAGISS